MSQSGTATSVFGFTGEQWDATGLEYLRARYYSSAQGRFVTEDTAAGNDTLPQSLHLYSYAWDNPINLIDSSGHQVALPLLCTPGQPCPTGILSPQQVDAVNGLLTWLPSVAKPPVRPAPEQALPPQAAGAFCPFEPSPDTSAYWELPNMLDAFHQYYSKLCGPFCEFTDRIAAPWGLKDVAMLLALEEDLPTVRAKQLGHFGKIQFRTQLTPEEKAHFGDQVMFRAVGLTTAPVPAAKFPPVGEGLLYRGGNYNIRNYTPRAEIGEVDISFRTSLSNKWPADPPPAQPVLRPGENYQVVDLKKLTPGSYQITYDSPGHAGVIAKPEELFKAIIFYGKFPKNFPPGWLAGSAPPPAGGN